MSNLYTILPLMLQDINYEKTAAALTVYQLLRGTKMWCCVAGLVSYMIINFVRVQKYL